MSHDELLDMAVEAAELLEKIHEAINCLRIDEDGYGLCDYFGSGECYRCPFCTYGGCALGGAEMGLDELRRFVNSFEE